MGLSLLFFEVNVDSFNVTPRNEIPARFCTKRFVSKTIFSEIS